MGRLKEILDYCAPWVNQMWAASIVGIALGCAFNDAEAAMLSYYAEIGEKVPTKDQWSKTSWRIK